jgi:putative phosphoesterase
MGSPLVRGEKEGRGFCFDKGVKSMRIGILSDSHDNMPAIAKAVSIFNDAEVYHVLHAGDLVAPFVSIPLKTLNMEFTAVFGNNDGERIGLSNVFKGHIHRAPYSLEIGGKNILLMHEPDNLDALVASGQFDAIVYGHTHESDVRKGKTVVINPGEACGWLKGDRTIAIWDLTSGDVEIMPVS